MGLTINKTNIKTQLNISVSTYDDRIDMTIPQILSLICSELKNDFIAQGYSGRIYDSGDLVFTTTTITYDTDEIDITLSAGDFIRIYGTDYNDGLYQINSINSGVITIETSKSMKAEEVSGYIALVRFPDEFLSLIADYIDQTIVQDSNIKKEKIDDVEIEYFNSMTLKDFFAQNSAKLYNYRRAFYEELYKGSVY